MTNQSFAQLAIGAGVSALSGGLLWMERTRTLIAADVHLGYEEVIGGALPLWSAAPSVAILSSAAKELSALEIVLLGDVIHGAALSPGARRRISDVLGTLRTFARVELIAGNHEGKSRGTAVLGQTHEELMRDDWLLLHGDRPKLESRAIIGHLHPSLHLGGDESVPVFLASQRLIVVPAMTPYSRGLDIRSEECIRALGAWNLRAKDVQVVAASRAELFALGTLSALRMEFDRATAPRNRFRRKFLQPDR